MQKLLVLTGPTAVGKTGLSLRLAKMLDGEIISADSMQVYRGMDIGTDKIRPDQMEGIPHHLIDILDPREEFNIYRFQQEAVKAIEAISARGHLPMLVGGTGFYIQSVLYRTRFAESDDNRDYRKELELRAEKLGAHALHEELVTVDPASAAVIHENNVKRVIRALEYYHQTGECISSHNERERTREPAYDFRYYVLTDEREKLYERINVRVDQMIERGLEQEVRGLLALGLTGEEPSMQGLGYRQMTGYLKGEWSFGEAVDRIKRDTRHFAKRQLTWFRRERDVFWLDRRMLQGDDAIIGRILADSWTTGKENP
ncbi:MAG: tRNA (adenosine(37)-N6)-dimethylallyltransferase MiaA [Lachnospiraceae bacterium]|nr:tRNA (adenosine(37)-N6)-dimethylallyltransferase MiaA [Lachnospiraceae bacterium]